MAEATVSRPRLTRRPAVALRWRTVLSHPAWPALGVTLVAGYLRLRGLSGSHANPFYDAAVRSMGESWHNFFFGAYDPSAQLAVDKPPVDLWVQVASVKLLGWSTTALVLPAAIFGTVAVPLLYDFVRRVFGTLAGVCAALALAVLPISVVSSRSDAVDSMMMALAVLAVWLCLRAVQTGRVRWLYAAALVMGIDFNVKLFEALIPLPAFALLYLLGAREPIKRRILHLAVAGAIFVAAALAWVVAVALSPGHHPYPIGSTNGSVWNVVFVFNGINRIFRHRNVAAPGLFGPSVGGRIGPELVAAYVLGGLALVVGAGLRGRRRWPPAVFAAAVALAVWLITGTILFQRMPALRARYLEAFTASVAAALGVGLGVLAVRSARGGVRAAVALAAGLAAVPLVLRAVTSLPAAARPGPLAIAAGVAAALLGIAVAAAARALPAWRRRAPVTAAVVAALALFSVLDASTSYSARMVRMHTTDSGHGQQLPAHTLRLLDHFLVSHRGGTKYEYAASDPSRAGGLIVHDGQPALLLETYRGHQVITPAKLRSIVLAGQVRWFVTKRPCTPSYPGGCVPVLRWLTTHGTYVGRRYGLPYTVRLYEVTPAQARASGG